jgi:hypothetical protein
VDSFCIYKLLVKHGMQLQIPHFNYYAKRVSSKSLWCFEADGEVVYETSNTEDLDKFYRVFGYTREMGMAGILPEEFIWTEYIKGEATAKYTACYQMHIIEYLKNHSAKFRNLYGVECEKWLVAHAEAKVAEDALCVACKMKPFCSKRNTQP